MSDISCNLETVEKNICEACRRAGRKREEVKLIAVSKTKPTEDIREAIHCGIRSFGENKVQELTGKITELSDIRVPLEWHMIGHLQSNKVRPLIGHAALIHSVDSLHLAEVIEQESARIETVTQILLEINIAGEDSKFGIRPGDAEELVRKIAVFPHVRICGLMTVAPYTEDPESNREYFRQMRKLLIDIGSKNIDNVTMDVLSMGMTGDYEVAVEEGATCIRVGTGIFGSRYYPPKAGERINA